MPFLSYWHIAFSIIVLTVRPHKAPCSCTYPSLTHCRCRNRYVDSVSLGATHSACIVMSRPGDETAGTGSVYCWGSGRYGKWVTRRTLKQEQCLVLEPLNPKFQRHHHRYTFVWTSILEDLCFINAKHIIKVDSEFFWSLMHRVTRCGCLSWQAWVGFRNGQSHAHGGKCCIPAMR